MVASTGVVDASRASDEGARERSKEDGCIMTRAPSVDGVCAMNRSRTSSFSTDRSASTVALAPDGDYERERVSALASWPESAVDALRSEQDFIVHQSAALWTHRTPALHDPDSQETQLDVAKGLLARERETHGSFVFDARAAHHCAFRSQLVEWILDVCAGERFGPTTADVAIAYTVRS